jgi:hypothetical protein
VAYVDVACERVLVCLQFGYGEVLQGFTPDEVWGKVVQKIREVCFPYRPYLPNVNIPSLALMSDV